jgi:hypothetical protein
MGLGGGTRRGEKRLLVLTRAIRATGDRKALSAQIKRRTAFYRVRVYSTSSRSRLGSFPNTRYSNGNVQNLPAAM